MSAEARRVTAEWDYPNRPSLTGDDEEELWS